MQQSEHSENGSGRKKSILHNPLTPEEQQQALQQAVEPITQQPTPVNYGMFLRSFILQLPLKFTQIIDSPPSNVSFFSAHSLYSLRGHFVSG
jgi:hypothetical protein